MKPQQKQLLNYKLRLRSFSEFPLDIANAMKSFQLIPTNAEGIEMLNFYFVELEHHRHCKQFDRTISVNRYISLVNRNQDAVNIIDAYTDRVGELICFLHLDDIVYGDLNVTNMLLVQKDVVDVKVEPNWMDLSNLYVVLSDFGTCYKNSSPHAKATDLYNLEQSMDEAYDLIPGLFGKILKAYIKYYSKDSITEIITKYEEIKFNGPVCPRGI